MSILLVSKLSRYKTIRSDDSFFEVGIQKMFADLVKTEKV